MAMTIKVQVEIYREGEVEPDECRWLELSRDEEADEMLIIRLPDGRTSITVGTDELLAGVAAIKQHI
jgi:hypothetical protein